MRLLPEPLRWKTENEQGRGWKTAPLFANEPIEHVFCRALRPAARRAAVATSRGRPAGQPVSAPLPGQAARAARTAAGSGPLLPPRRIDSARAAPGAAGGTGSRPRVGGSDDPGDYGTGPPAVQRDTRRRAPPG